MKLATRILAAVLPPTDAGRSTLGDILEEFNRRPHGIRRHLWLWVVIVDLVVRYLPSAMAATFRGSGAEIRQAVRSVRRAPYYSLTVIATIAVSMALSATVFGLVDGVLFKPLPYPNPGDLYAVGGTFDNDRTRPETVVNMLSPAELASLRQAVPEAALTGLTYSSVQFEDGDFGAAAFVDDRFFDVFGTRPLLGGLMSDQVRHAEPATPIVISHRVWLSKFGGDPSAVGRVLAGRSKRNPTMRIAGVLPPEGFVPPLPGNLQSSHNQVDVLELSSSDATTERGLMAFARVPKDRLPAVKTALRVALREMRSSAAPLEPGLTETQRRIFAPFDDVEFVPLEQVLTSRSRPVLSLVFGTALALALLVLMNLGALAAARSQQRVRDVSLRRALGARLSDLVRTAVAEHLVLVVPATVVGLLIAPTLLAFTVRLLPTGLILIKSVQVDWRVTIFAGLLAAAAVLLVTLLSVRAALDQPAIVGLAATDETPARVWMRRVLVAGQVSLAFALFLGAALFATSLARVYLEEPGVRVDHAAIIYVTFGDLVAHDRATALVAELRSLPGVTSAAEFSSSMFEGPETPSAFRAPKGSASALRPSYTTVGPGFFEAAGIELRSGRLPSNAEFENNARVLVVSQSVARAFWPGRPAIGQTLRAWNMDFTVIGTVRDARLGALDVEPAGAIYRAASNGQMFGVGVFLVFSPNGAASLLTVRAEIARLEPTARVLKPRRIEDAIADSIRPRRLSAFAASTFGVAAVAIVAIGMLGLVAMTTSRRTREMGIRLTLGATPANVVTMLVWEQMGAVLTGLGAGAVLAWWLTRFVQGYLYEVSPTSPIIWTMSALLLVSTAAFGALGPALSAGRTDPAMTLRAE